MTYYNQKQIPFFNLSRQYEGIEKDVENAVCEVLRSGQYIEGAAVKKLEQMLCSYLGVRYAVSCGNGTDALRIALQAAGVGQGDEVIVTSFSFFATAEAVAQLGAIPVFADISRDNFNISVEDIRRKVSKKTKAILPVHIFGMPADMDEINRIAVENGISVIEDACQAIGAEYKGIKAGVLGNMGCFSFYPTKNLGAFGDGGMIVTNDSTLADVCRAIKSHAAGRMGAKAYETLYHKKVRELEQLNSETKDSGLYDPCKYYNYFTGCNSRLDSIQAAVLLVKLKYLDTYNEKRRRIAARYSEELKDLPLWVPRVHMVDRSSCWHQYAVLCDQKEALIRHLESNGVGAGSFYPVPLHMQKAFEYLEYQDGSLPVVEDVCRKSVCLPIFPELYDEEVTYIIDVIKKFFR